MSKLDNIAQKGPYKDHRNAHNYDGATDRVGEPLTRLFMDLVTQLKLLTPSVQGGSPNYNGKLRNGWWTGSNKGHRWHANDHHHKKEEQYMDHHHRSFFRNNGHQWDNKYGHKSNSSRMPHARINEVESNSECNLECLTRSNIEEHIDEEVEPVPTSPKN